MEQADPIFVNLKPGDDPMIMESFCVQCENQGTTSIMLTKIPFFKEVIISAFHCEHCGYKNNEIQSGGALQDHGEKIVFRADCIEDLSRDLVRSEFATLKILELDLELPPSKKGSLNTFEGFLQTSYEELSDVQDLHRKANPEFAMKLGEFLQKIVKVRNGEVFPVTLVLDDPSGNSYIKNPFAPKKDPKLKYQKYLRTMQQYNDMGFYPEQKDLDEISQRVGLIENTIDEEIIAKENKLQQNVSDEYVFANRIDFNKPLTDDIEGECHQFLQICHCCQKEGVQKMCITSIPYFKEIIIMSFDCDKCGVKSTEVKTGGEISKQGKKITLNVQSSLDLSRDLFKSDSARVFIPEVDLEIDYGTLGGVYTTVEGLVDKIHENFEKYNPFSGDSSDIQTQEKLKYFFDTMKQFSKGQQNFTLVIDDPLDNSFVQNPFYPEQDKPNIIVELYDRDYDMNEEFGLNDIQTENY